MFFCLDLHDICHSVPVVWSLADSLLSGPGSSGGWRLFLGSWSGGSGSSSRASLFRSAPGRAQLRVSLGHPSSSSPSSWHLPGEGQPPRVPQSPRASSEGVTKAAIALTAAQPSLPLSSFLFAHARTEGNATRHASAFPHASSILQCRPVVTVPTGSPAAVGGARMRRRPCAGSDSKPARRLGQTTCSPEDPDCQPIAR